MCDFFRPLWDLGKGFQSQPEGSKKFENGQNHVRPIYQPTGTGQVARDNNLETMIGNSHQDDPPLKYSDVEFSKLPLDEKIYLLIETVCYRIDHSPDDADLTCINMQFFYFEDCANSLKISVENFCSTLRRDLNDARIALRNVDHIMNSFHKHGRRLVFYNNTVYVEGELEPSSWITSTFNDCMKYKRLLETLHGMARELVVSIGYFMEFKQDVLAVKTSQTPCKNTKHRILDTIYFGLTKIIERLRKDHQHFAADLLKELQDNLQIFYDSKKNLDLLRLFAHCCYNSFGKLTDNPKEAVAALKQLKKYLCTYNRYYELYDLLANMTDYGWNGYKMLDGYRKQKDSSNCEAIISGCNWQKLQNDLEKLQLLLVDVRRKWDKFHEHYLTAMNNQPRNQPTPMASRAIQPNSVMLQQSNNFVERF